MIEATKVSEALELAAQCQQDNRLAEAQQIYQKILEQQPHNPDALHGLGSLVQKTGNFQNAEQLFRDALKVQPKSLKTWFSLGNLYYAQTKLPEAEECYLKILELQPKLAAVYNNLGYLQQLQGKLEEAIATYQKALELQPNCTEAEINLANILHRQGKLSSEKYSHYAELNHQLGIKLQKTGNLEAAITCYQQAIALQPDLAIAYYNLGVALQEQGKLEEAISSYQKVLEFESSNGKIYHQLTRQKLNYFYGGYNELLEGNSHPRLKVAFVCQPFVMTNFHDPVDSLGILVHHLVRLLVKDCEVTVYAPGIRSGTESYESVNYVYIEVDQDELLLERLEKNPEFSNPQRPLFSSSLYYSRYIQQIAKDLTNRKCDLVHIINLSQFIPVIRAINPQIKIVLHMQCEWLNQLDHIMIERRISQADLVIGCSKYISEQICSHFPQLSDRIQTLPNGVKIDRFMNFDPKQNLSPERQDNCSHRLLFVGRISPEKGIHILLEAFQKVLELYPKTELILVGPIHALPYEYHMAMTNDSQDFILEQFYSGEGWLDYLKKYLSQLQSQFGDHVASQVVFPGLVPHSQLATYYQQADIFVFPSAWNEPFGMPIIEAMAAGLPVVATQGGAFPEIVEHDKTGLLVERGDADDLAAVLQRLLADKELRKSMGQAGCERAVNMFSFEKIVDDLLFRYHSLVNPTLVQQ